MEREIRVLPPGVADKIAAGEVAERPCAVVKELVENAVDAGADRITVEIKNGGIKLIRVTDNGCGIPAEQVASAFLRHATSKLRSAEELYSISTMGFRGEALSSICAVARVEVITRTEGAENGSHYIVDHGVCGEADEIACAKGTIMSAEDLFANVPARMKFLKKDSTEAGYISDLMTRLALSRPDISFEYIMDGKLVFKTSGDGSLVNVILKTYGLKFARAVLPVNYKESGVEITGVIGRPELAFGNRTRQTVLVNGRYIKNHVISKVAEEAFRNAIMTGRFPFFVLNIALPPSQVDVNVHPAKTEVKFANEKELYDIVYHAVKNAMYSSDAPAPKESGEAEKTVAPLRDSSDSEVHRRSAFSARPDRNVIRDYITYTTPIERPNIFVPDMTESNNKTEEVKTEKPETEKSDRTKDEISGGESLEGISLAAPPENRPGAPLDNCRIAGQVLNTYIIIEAGGSVYMIDQHAAHERYGFEELKAAYMKNERMSQLLLVPVTMNMTHGEYDALMSNIEIFRRFGFEIEEFGINTVIINETPIAVSEEEIKSLVYEILGAVQDNIRHPVADFEEKALDMISCKKAIKGGDSLTLPEMTRVVEIVRELSERGITTCPHGRPIMIEFTKREIEKLFKRIV